MGLRHEYYVVWLVNKLERRTKIKNQNKSCLLQVVGRHQYHVRPLQADLNQNFLSAEAAGEFGVQEGEVRAAPPLATVIQQFDRLANQVSYISVVLYFYFCLPVFLYFCICARAGAGGEPDAGD